MFRSDDDPPTHSNSVAVKCLTVKVHQQRTARHSNDSASNPRYDDDFLNYNINADVCVGESGDQERCDNYIACVKKFPKRLQDQFHTCVRNNYPGGTLGKCNEKSTLFGTSDEFNKYLLCFANNITDKSDLSDDELKQFNDYKKCIQKEGGKCFKEREFPS
ncbi:uncharacterized protein TNIN_335981 [Trichonephila inaurata madagascariensis]|uniref:Uncharacterized protein n=1 Tax=Trichonephila inaurata madagascariensis TaxID=2747483 RepID=A0A8X6XLJ5_9ARAC|nr:uncharacterized protein TNIN_335981 [Trichonephila inaurata madagascariensis]